MEGCETGVYTQGLIAGDVQQHSVIRRVSSGGVDVADRRMTDCDSNPKLC